MELPERLRILVIYGGQSAEHDVSRVSAANIVDALDPDRYDVVPIGIDRDGTWMLADAAGSPELAAPSDGREGARGGDLGGLPVGGAPMEALPELRRRSDDHIPTVALPVLHGPHGEDGTIQGLFELAGVPYVGSGVLGSAVAMDKAMAKTVLGAAGVPQARYRVLRRWEIDDVALATVAGDLGLPLFVKPANMGSSVGVSRVADDDSLRPAVDAALAHDEIVVFEEAIVGRELEIGVLGNESPRVSVPGEIVPAAEFYDYDDKYRDGAATTIVPAELSPAEAAEMGDLALAAYRALRCEGLARVDMFYDAGGRGFVVNEVNTFPGFTPISMFPSMWQASGLTYSELLDEMIRLALDRHARRSR